MLNPLRWLRSLIDSWAYLDYKSKVHSDSDRPWVAPMWVGYHARRLETYKYYAAQLVGKAANYQPDPSGRREYGDPALIVDIIRSAVTGDDVSLSVDGADADLPDEASTEEKATASAALARLDELNEWADAERLILKVVETKRDTIGLGDGVMALGVNHAKGRVRLRCYDPGHYFPSIDPHAPEDEFSQRVDIGFEVEEDEAGGEVRHLVHRITWELGPLPEGEVSRPNPYGDRPATQTCYLTDAIWRTEDISSPGGGELRWDRFPLDKAEFVEDEEGPINRRDLRLDFIPVVHYPATVAVKAHFGQSVLGPPSQLLEDIGFADTDAANAAAMASTPVVSTSGPSTDAAGNSIVLRPGLILGGAGTDGRMNTLDMSAPLTAVSTYRDGLRDLLSVITRIPPEVLGRVQGADQPSGVKVALSFGPLRSLVEEMRLVSREKDALLLKFVQRMQVAAGFWEGEVLPANINFGSFLPSDQSATIDATMKLFAAHLISRRTAISTLVDEGIIDVELADELEACEAEDFAAALAYFEATNDEAGTFDLLHKDQPAAGPAPPAVPALPVAPGQPVLDLRRNGQTVPGGQPVG